ncbi:MAG TPA: DUF2188 domain-containing protein, partial [Burkholderiales bacterium]|nr:DUF2188 domain-containing protein [Burkholderiales bacterium]
SFASAADARSLMTIRYVVAGKRGRWIIWKEGSSTPVAHARTKDDAVLAARRLAQRDAGELAVYLESGILRHEHRCRRKS